MTNSTEYIGQEVSIKIDRPLGSKHPVFDWEYKLNYGFVPDTLSPDGEELDAYVCLMEEPVETFTGKCVAVIRRKNDDDDKLVIIPVDVDGISDEEIKKQIHFQEQWFESDILR